MTVTLEQDAHMYFASILLPTETRIAVTAKAIVTVPSGDFCILSLDTNDRWAFRNSGSVNLVMPECGIAVNSYDEEAMDVNGFVTIDVKDINIVGDLSISGASARVEYETLNVGTNVVYDPYANLEIPTFSGCSRSDMRHPTTINSTATLSPGVYCGGIRISGTNTVTFSPGVYILDGGGLTVTGGGSIVANDVNIVLTNSGGSSYGSFGTIDITGNRDIYFSARETGDLAGIVFFQDRRASESGVNKILGSNIVQVDGAIYTPRQELNFGGNAAVTSEVCTQVIGRTVVMHGNPHVGSSCDGSATKPIGVVRARLSA